MLQKLQISNNNDNNIKFWGYRSYRLVIITIIILNSDAIEVTD